ncbi:MAG: XRE family transcriptional regulator [Gemmatimonadaceae bacterium]
MAKKAKKFSELRAKMAPERRVAAERRTTEMMSEMALAELRQARHLSQKMLAEAMETSQPDVSKLEKRTDTYISTLRSYIEAMGGQLEIVARFPEGEVRITQFSALEEVST